jgi:hypothetical protein
MAVSLAFSAVIVLGVVFMAKFLIALLGECKFPAFAKTFQFLRRHSFYYQVDGDSDKLMALGTRHDDCCVEFLRQRLAEKRQASILTMDIRSIPFRDQPAQLRRKVGP